MLLSLSTSIGKGIGAQKASSVPNLRQLEVNIKQAVFKPYFMLYHFPSVPDLEVAFAHVSDMGTRAGTAQGSRCALMWPSCALRSLGASTAPTTPPPQRCWAAATQSLTWLWQHEGSDSP